MQNFGVSYAEIIISAIFAFAENEKIKKSLLDEIKKIVKSEIGETLKNFNSTQEEIKKSEMSKTTKMKNRKMLR